MKQTNEWAHLNEVVQEVSRTILNKGEIELSLTNKNLLKDVFGASFVNTAG